MGKGNGNDEVLVLEVGLGEADVELVAELVEDEDVVVLGPGTGRSAGTSGSTPPLDEEVWEAEVGGPDVALADEEGAAVAPEAGEVGVGTAGAEGVGVAGTAAPGVGCEAPPADWPTSEVAFVGPNGLSAKRASPAMAATAKPPTANRPASRAFGRPADPAAGFKP